MCKLNLEIDIRRLQIQIQRTHKNLPRASRIPVTKRSANNIKQQGMASIVTRTNTQLTGQSAVSHSTSLVIA